MNTFLSNQNIKTLWDVIVDEDIIKNKPREFIQNVSQMFINKMEQFYHAEKGMTKSLLELNQKYIMIVLNYAYQMEQNMKQVVSLPPPQKLTQEEFQNDKRSKFEHDLERKQKEFESSVEVKTPPKPKFTDNFEDTPIGNMDEILKQMTEQRKYDIYTSSQKDVQNASWLTPQETSVKNEKMSRQQNNASQSQNNVKFIKIKEEIDNKIIQSNVINLENDSPRKTVSWGENKTYHSNIENTDENLFKKLKKIVPSREQDTNIELVINEDPQQQGDQEPKNFLQIINDDKYEKLQYQINGLNEKVENMNANINMILELLKNNNISTSSN
jgi:hypothetical protein